MTTSTETGTLPTESEMANLLDRRNAPMQKLAREHLDSLAFADEIAQIAEWGDPQELTRGAQMVVDYNTREMEAHLQHEEQTIFAPLIQTHRRHVELCIALAREHGVLRTLVERLSTKASQEDLAQFALLLKRHTLQEEGQLFPYLEDLFTPAQWDAMVRFRPLGRADTSHARSVPQPKASSQAEQAWLGQIERWLGGDARPGGRIVLFPRYRPDLSMKLAEHLGLRFFDYQKAVMEDLGPAAETLTLEQLSDTLKTEAGEGGILCHNAEALLCVKSPSERQAWLASFLATAWPASVLLPITVFQADVPQDHPGVCDMELHRMPAV